MTITSITRILVSDYGKGKDNMLFFSLVFVPVILTGAMFLTRNAMLGFPSAMFWAIAGGYAYTQSTALWDTYFLFAFASLLGMTTFCALGAWGLREKRDTPAEQEMEKGDGQFIDEVDETPEPSERTLRLRQRAKARRG